MSLIQSALGSDDINDKGFTTCVHQSSPVRISSDTLEYSIREFGKPYSQLQRSSSSPVPDSSDLNSSLSRRPLPVWQTMIDYLTELGPSPTQDIDVHDTQKSDRVFSKNLEHNFNIASTLCKNSRVETHKRYHSGKIPRRMTMDLVADPLSEPGIYSD